MSRKHMTLRRFETWELGGELYANSPGGPVSVDFTLAIKHLIPAELMAEYWYERGGAAPVNLSRPSDWEPISNILERFAKTPSAF